MFQYLKFVLTEEEMASANKRINDLHPLKNDPFLLFFPTLNQIWHYVTCKEQRDKQLRLLTMETEEEKKKREHQNLKE